MFTETKGGDGAVQEEEKERRRPGQRGREVDGKGGRDYSVFPFRMVFIVTSNADLQQHPTPKPPQPSVRPVGPSLLFFTIVRDQVDSNWLFVHEADFTPSPGRGPFCRPSEVISVPVVNMPDGGYQVVEARPWTLKAFLI